MFFRKPKPQPIIDQVEEFRRQVDFVAELFKLDPTLPELQQLKDQAAGLIIHGDKLTRSAMYYLRQLNPDDSTHENGRTLIVFERMFGGVLQPWSVARHHRPYLDESLTRVIADNKGTRLFCYGSDVPEVSFQAGMIDPFRLADPGNRYSNACILIKEFTGVELDYRDHWDPTDTGMKTKTITVIKSAGGVWQVELDRVKVAAG